MPRAIRLCVLAAFLGGGLFLTASYSLWLDPLEQGLWGLAGGEESVPPALQVLVPADGGPFLVLALISSPRQEGIRVMVEGRAQGPFEGGMLRVVAGPGDLLEIYPVPGGDRILIRVVGARGIRFPPEGTQWELDQASLRVRIR